MDSVFAAVGQVLFIMLFAPILSGVIKKIKALLQNRQGPRVLQPYYDLQKYLNKDMVISEHASWLFHVTPYAVLGCMLSAGLFIPAALMKAPLSAYGDLFLVVYLFVAARFFMVVASLDTASAFAGMGGSREMAISALVEPVLLLSLLTVSLFAQSTNLSTIVSNGIAVGWSGISIAHIFALLAFIIVTLAETGRIPVDNPDTHLELTMVHEGMLLEYSGKYLAMLQWAASIKQLLVFSLLANLFFAGVLNVSELSPLAAALCYIAKLLFIGFGVAMIEISTSKMRLFRVPELLGASFILSVLAIISL